jgi:hypothetical protein
MTTTRTPAKKAAPAPRLKMPVSPASAAILIESTPEAVVPVDLVGVRYLLQPVKSYLTLKLAIDAKTAGDDPEAMLGSLGDWIDSAFGEEEGVRVRERLADPHDDLDLQHITTLMSALVERSSGNPPT